MQIFPGAGGRVWVLGGDGLFCFLSPEARSSAEREGVGGSDGESHWWEIILRSGTVTRAREAGIVGGSRKGPPEAHGDGLEETRWVGR